jgi:serine phosphatase RsbU (regulator of sigma subunit)
MSDGITDVCREDRKNIERWKRSAVAQLLKTFSTKELVDELSKREGVREYSSPTPEDGWCLYVTPKNSVGGTKPFAGDGPARILVVID